MDLDSPVVAWQARVVEELARRVDEVIVMTERLGRVKSLPNVEVHAIPRRPLGIPQRVGGGVFFNPEALSILRRRPPDLCFIHMAHQWTYRLAPTFTFMQLPVVVWYAHGTVTRRLHVSHRLAKRIITSSPEGFRIPSGKVRVIGQGIDTDLYSLRESRRVRSEVVYVGRIARRKRIERLLRGVEEFSRRRPGVELGVRLVGPVINSDDRTYLAELRDQAADIAVEVRFEGPIPPDRLPPVYDDAFVHLSLSETGSMDKTILETLARGIPAITSNPAFRALLRDFPELLLSDGAPETVARALDGVFSRQQDYEPSALRSLVEGKHDLSSYADRLHAELIDVARAPA